MRATRSIHHALVKLEKKEKEEEKKREREDDSGADLGFWVV